MPSSAFIAAPFLLVIYYAVLIARRQRPPKSTSVVVRYEPPPDLTPAAARYIWRGTVDQRTIACVFAGLATKGRITLERVQHGAYNIKKSALPGSAPPLNAEEQSTMEWLFSNFLDSKIFNPGSDSNGCIGSLRGLLDRNLSGKYQSARTGWAALGMLASFVVSLSLASLVSGNTGFVLKFTGTLFLAAFMAAVISAALLVPAAVDLLRGLGSIPRLIMALAFTSLAVATVVGIFLRLVHYAPAELGIMVCVLVAINVAAVPLLRSVTPKGVEAQQQIAGFREYLLKVEQDPLNRLVKAGTAPPSNAVMLSYAIALEVKEAWGDALTNACFLG